MKIGLDLRLYGTRQGGIGRYCQQLFPRILKLDNTSQYIGFVNPRTTDATALKQLQQCGNLTIVPVNARHYSLAEQTTFLKVLNQQNLDLVHFPNFNVPLFYKKSFVVTIHDMVHHKISGAKKSHLLHYLAYQKVIAGAAKNAQRIVTVSEYSKKDISKILQISADKIKVIYEGNSLGAQVDNKLLAATKKNLLLTKPYFLFVGVLERKKNLVNLTRGLDILLQKYRADVDMVIVGPIDKHYPEIKHKALDIKNNNHLIFTGYVEDAELKALYKGAYAFVSASLHEGFGLPGVEALAFGLPLLVSNMEVFNEIYDNAAVYFNPLDPEDIAEKMNLLVRDPQFHEQLQKKSFERSLNFSWDKAAAETLEVYNNVIIQQ